jgi:Rrf2 family protein
MREPLVPSNAFILSRPGPRNGRGVKANSSMQLTRAADYAVRAAVHLATQSPLARLSLPQLAKATGSPESFLSKVLQALCRAGLIESRRGQSGGFAILPRGRQASVLEVIEAIDGPICLNACLISGLSCDRKTWCPAHPVWIRAQQAMVGVLAGSSVADLASQVQTESAADPTASRSPASSFVALVSSPAPPHQTAK